VKPKIAEMKEKLVDYVTNPNQQQVMRHVSARDKLGKRYKGSNRFTIDEDLESGELLFITMLPFIHCIHLFIHLFRRIGV
jgi:hypothetical protein